MFFSIAVCATCSTLIRCSICRSCISCTPFPTLLWRVVALNATTSRGAMQPQMGGSETYLSNLENCTVSRAPAAAVVATDTASADDDCDNGARLHGLARFQGWDRRAADRWLGAIAGPARRYGIRHGYAASSGQTFVLLSCRCGSLHPDARSSLRRPPRACKVERKELGHLCLDRLHPLVTGDADTVIAVLDEVCLSHFVQPDRR
jgi:hypothetical protein